MVATDAPTTHGDEGASNAAEVEADAPKVDPLVDELVSALQANGGNLKAAGAFTRATLLALAKAFDADPDVEADFLTRLVKCGVEERDLTAWMSAVDAARPGGGIRLLAAEAVIASEPPTFLVDGVLEEGGSAVLYGPSGLGKSFVGLDIAASVSCGVPWLGRPVRQGAVIFVAAEGAGGLNDRLSAWKTKHEVDWLSDLYIVRDAVNLMIVQDAVELIYMVETVRPVLVIFDTYARCMVGGDEISAKDTGRVISNLDRIRRETGAATLSIHHTDKSGKTERGSGALRAAVDTMIELEKPKSGLVLTCSKQRNVEPFAPINIQLVKVGDALVPEIRSQAVTADEAVAQSPYRADIESTLSEAHENGLTPLSQNKVLGAVGGNAAKVTEALKALAADPTSPVTMMEKKGRGYQYDWHPT